MQFCSQSSTVAKCDSCLIPIPRYTPPIKAYYKAPSPVWFLAVTVPFLTAVKFWFVFFSFVTVWFCGFDITLAAIACILVENLLKWLWFREVLVSVRNGALSYVYFHILLYGDLYHMMSLSPCLWSQIVCFFVWGCSGITTFVQHLLIHFWHYQITLCWTMTLKAVLFVDSGIFFIIEKTVNSWIHMYEGVSFLYVWIVFSMLWLCVTSR